MSQPPTSQKNPPSLLKDVEVSVHLKPHCLVELHVKASSSLVSKAKKKAVKEAGKELTIPGFRKGKAPQEIIEKKFPHQVEQKLHKAIADLAFIEAQKEQKIPILNNSAPIHFDLKEKNEHGATLHFSYETEPAIPSVDPKLFKPKPVDRPEVEEKQIEEAVHQMRFFFATWKSVTERPIQEGDYIMIDLETLEGETPQKVFNHIRFEVSKNRMARWMQELVLGAKAGDVLEGMSEADDTATEEEKKEFVPKKVRLTVIKVEEAELPLLDDEFAKKVGAENLEVMRKSVTDMLNSQADEKVKTSLREQVNDFFVEEFPFDLPKSLIEAETKHRFEQLNRDPRFKNDWKKKTEEEKKEFEAKIEKEATEAVRLFYLSRHVIQEAKIPITQKEVQDEAIATLQSAHGQKVEVDKIPKEIFALALSKVILAKAQDLILNEEKK